MSPTERRRRRSLLNVESMERRELLSGAPVLFTSGALASRPTEWGVVPSSAHGELASYFHANIAVTQDVYGKPIDFNKDGLTDLVMGGGITETVGYYPGEELVGSSRGGFAQAYLADPNGGLKVIPGPTASGDVKAWSWGHFAVLDINGDGSQDVLRLGTGGKISLFVYDPVGATFLLTPDASTLHHADYVGSSSLTMGDVDGDGLPDLAVPDYVGGGQLAGFSIFLAQAPPPGGSWDGQFLPDAVATVTVREAVPLLNDGFASAGPGNVQPILADFNGDGRLDMVIPEQQGVSFYSNPGGGEFARVTPTFVPSVGSVLGFNLQAADFNNDGKMDLISTPNPVSLNLAGTIDPGIHTWNDVPAPVSVYLNTTPTGGAASFNVVAAGASDQYYGFLQVGDFNLDGNMDIGASFASRQGTTFAVGTGDGQGGFGVFKLYVAYTNADDGVYEGWTRQVVAFGVGDFDGDHQLDVAATASTLNMQDFAVSITGLSYNKTFASPGALPANPLPAFAGQPYTLQLTPSGGDAARPYTYTLDPQSVPLPAGLTMSASGLITGTPTQSGPFQLLVDVAQPNGLRGRSFVYLTVQQVAQGTISPGVAPNAVLGAPFNLQFTTSGGPAAWDVTFGALPPGLTLSPGGLLSGTATGTGQYGFQITATGNGFQSSLSYTMVSQAAGAPIVTSLARHGVHNQKTTLVVAFSQDMNPQSASSLANYVLTTAGRDGRFGTRDDVTVALASAVYDATARTVTLSPVARTLPLCRPYRLTIIGTPTQGLSSTAGTYLGGQGVASPGTNYVRVFGTEVLVTQPAPVVRAAPRVASRPALRSLAVRR
ncbi:FG-GAP-like repeat-containing protein [Paludisphaera mucosa]|uniref:FG-GAP-like repeat-containing protein n=1 Tax=Paludisphaera mucosa TaxID=3030827 RepID=A0ABT6FCD1_9BACT|nr:FG-GAP-like repeat-containing protein [Paludisphaera mucosa]MDG3005035.1 FG-GAP-like repeat-containing protein [Paludisphaera mucosa]